MEPQPRLFTRAEATSIIPELKPLLLDLQRLKHALDLARSELAAMLPAARGNGGGARAAELEQQIMELVAEIEIGIRRVQAMGVELKDIDAGLVDFPSIRNGRVVYLCWLVTEDSIDYWHEVDAGFAGRQPL